MTFRILFFWEDFLKLTTYIGLSEIEENLSCSCLYMAQPSHLNDVIANERGNCAAHHPIGRIADHYNMRGDTLTKIGAYEEERENIIESSLSRFAELTCLLFL